MQYNLAEFLATKSIKQVINMLKTRHDWEIAASEYVSKYSEWPYYDVPRYVAGVKNAQKKIDDCRDWMDDAVYYFSESLWNDMIDQAGYCQEGNCHQDLL